MGRCTRKFKGVLKCCTAIYRRGFLSVQTLEKVDRLTRSLADFAKLVELFDEHQVSFVSVTQAFNTTTSMGRLTLNVLLSFAQFEREVTGERTRDKIAASKKKGIWMGGVFRGRARPDGSMKNWRAISSYGRIRRKFCAALCDGRNTARRACERSDRSRPGAVPNLLGEACVSETPRRAGRA